MDQNLHFSWFWGPKDGFWYLKLRVHQLGSTSTRGLNPRKSLAHPGLPRCGFFPIRDDSRILSWFTGWWFQIFFIFTPIGEDSHFD